MRSWEVMNNNNNNADGDGCRRRRRRGGRSEIHFFSIQLMRSIVPHNRTIAQCSHAARSTWTVNTMNRIPGEIQNTWGCRTVSIRCSSSLCSCIFIFKCRLVRTRRTTWKYLLLPLNCISCIWPYAHWHNGNEKRVVSRLCLSRCMFCVEQFARRSCSMVFIKLAHALDNMLLVLDFSLIFKYKLYSTVFLFKIFKLQRIHYALCGARMCLCWWIGVQLYSMFIYENQSDRIYPNE